MAEPPANPEPAESLEPDLEMSTALVAVAPEPQREPARRLGFWRRLVLGRREDGPGFGIEGAGRLRSIEDRMVGLERRIEDRIAGLEGQLAQFWAIDDRLGKLDEIETSLAELHKVHVDLVRRLERNGRALRLLAVFALIAAFAVVGLLLN
jgi:hypothetical protein